MPHLASKDQDSSEPSEDDILGINSGVQAECSESVYSPSLMPHNQIDTNSAHLNRRLVVDSIRKSYYPNPSLERFSFSQHDHAQQHQPSQSQQRTTITTEPLIPVGCQVLDPVSEERWECAYRIPTQPTTLNHTTITPVSSHGVAGEDRGCTWTGPFHELRSHFEASHYALEDAYNEPRMSLCLMCNKVWPGWDHPSGCLADGCSAIGTSLQRWYYGSAAPAASNADWDNESLVSEYPELTFSLSDSRDNLTTDEPIRGGGGDEDTGNATKSEEYQQQHYGRCPSNLHADDNSSGTGCATLVTNSTQFGDDTLESSSCHFYPMTITTSAESRNFRDLTNNEPSTADFTELEHTESQAPISRSIKATIKTTLRLLDYIKSNYSNRYIELSTLITITGSASSAYATTCSKYLEKTWLTQEMPYFLFYRRQSQKLTANHDRILAFFKVSIIYSRIHT